MKIDHLINGKAVAGKDYFETVNPATQGVLAEVASGGEAEVHAAVAAAKAAGAVTMNVGQFINSVVSFVLIAFSVFLLVKVVNRLYQKKDAAAPAPATRDCPFCATAIPLAATRCPHCTSQVPPAD